MRIRLLSDLHLEGNYFTYEHQGEDVLILAGDIHTKMQHDELLDTIPAHVEIYMVAGNHEAYGMNYHDVIHHLTGLQKEYPNFNFLNNKAGWLKDGTAIFGGTMFTGFNLYGDFQKWDAIQMAKRGISDFHVTKLYADEKYMDKERMWNTQDHINQHELFCRELDRWLKDTEGKKRIVVTHFMPTPQATHPRFKDSMLNPYFCENMEHKMGWDGYWLFGHTHDSFDGKVGDTRLVCNPKGYGTENRHGFNPALILEM